MSTRAQRNRDRFCSEAAKRFGLGKTSSILVAGPDALNALLWLCRHGYRHARLTGRATGPREPADVLLVSGEVDADDLRLLAAPSRGLIAGGLIIVQAAGEASAIGATLADMGFELDVPAAGILTAHAPVSRWRAAA